MKNFDFPHINDSPVDLSGREGAEREDLVEDEAKNDSTVTRTPEIILRCLAHLPNAYRSEARDFFTAIQEDSQRLTKALQVISGWSKCQCEGKHGDNPNCAVFIAETTLAALSLGDKEVTE